MASRQSKLTMSMTCFRSISTAVHWEDRVRDVFTYYQGLSRAGSALRPRMQAHVIETIGEDDPAIPLIYDQQHGNIATSSRTLSQFGASDFDVYPSASSPPANTYYNDDAGQYGGSYGAGQYGGAYALDDGAYGMPQNIAAASPAPSSNDTASNELAPSGLPGSDPSPDPATSPAATNVSRDAD